MIIFYFQEDSESEENLNFDDSNENGESSDYFEPDDESTIDEQESFEALNNEVVTNQENEILVLEQVIFFTILLYIFFTFSLVDQLGTLERNKEKSKNSLLDCHFMYILKACRQKFGLHFFTKKPLTL